MTSIEEIDDYLDNRIRQTRETITLLQLRHSTHNAAIYLPDEIEQIRLTTLLDIKTHITPR